MVSISGYGTYVPLYRIERAKIADQHGNYEAGGETAVPGHDENVLTLAVSAAKEAIEHARDPQLDAIFVATTSDPYSERGIAPHVAYAIGTPNDVRVADFQGSARAGTNALHSASDVVKAGGTALVVGADAIPVDRGAPAERVSGAGAGAIVLDNNGDVATFNTSVTNTNGFVGRFRAENDGITIGDDRFNRHVYTQTVSKTVQHSGSDEFDHAVLPAPDSDWGRRALEETAVNAELRTAFENVGYIGAAGTFLDLAVALERAAPGEKLLVASYGAGGSDAFTMTTDKGVKNPPGTKPSTHIDSKEYITYAKHLDYRDRLESDA
jgi:3-hydroxy-3-methylglutaryl CoA synthase